MTETGEGRREADGKKKAARTVTITLVKSGICTPKDQKATLQGLGFGRLGQRVVRDDSPALRGMIRKVRHLVEVDEGLSTWSKRRRRRRSRGPGREEAGRQAGAPKAAAKAGGQGGGARPAKAAKAPAPGPRRRPRPPARPAATGVHDLAPAAGATHYRKRVGRGPAPATARPPAAATRDRSRAPATGTSAGFEGGQMPLHRRVPKRGFTNIFRVEYDIVNLSDLDRFDAGAAVDAGDARPRRGSRARTGPSRSSATARSRRR